jgi:hypothetical protein
MYLDQFNGVLSSLVIICLQHTDIGLNLDTEETAAANVYPVRPV